MLARLLFFEFDDDGLKVLVSGICSRGREKSRLPARSMYPYDRSYDKVRVLRGYEVGGLE